MVFLVFMKDIIVEIDFRGFMELRFCTTILLIVVALVWAGSFIVVEAATQEIDPIDLGFLRFLVATPIMFFLLLLRKKQQWIPRKELPRCAILGLTGVTFLYLFQFVGISLTDASTAAVLINTNVVFIALLSFFMLKEKITVRRAGGIMGSFCGVVIVVLSNVSFDSFSLGSLFFVGSIFVLISALCWAVYSIVGKQLLQRYDNVMVTTYAFALGSLFYLPFVLPDVMYELSLFSLNVWNAVLYLAVVCSVFGYLGWYYALQRSEASKVAVFLNLIPIFTILMSFLLGKTINEVFLLGAVLIISGVYITQRS